MNRNGGIPIYQYPFYSNCVMPLYYPPYYLFAYSVSNTLCRNSFQYPQAIYAQPIPNNMQTNENTKKNGNMYVIPEINIKKETNSIENNKQDDIKNHRNKISFEEDEHLRKLVEKMGARKWKNIARHMPGRTERQCRDRYKNYLMPGYFTGQWTREEDEMLLNKHKELGSKWSLMTKFFTNRNANSLKSRWNYFVSRHTKELSDNKACNQLKDDEIDRLFYDYNDEKIILLIKMKIIWKTLLIVVFHLLILMKLMKRMNKTYINKF
ncbi:hypothetical protein M9Y10_029918 [Tritrichomonas musculus]|uniref:Myb-like DNA-binding domain containing protein n=1 Tax=Tritrichomonas musculus TaxID=1915356 RepID=A0ABR2KNW9_9EUKA